MKILGEADWISSDTKLPLRASKLSLGLSGSRISDASAVESSLAIMKSVEDFSSLANHLGTLGYPRTTLKVEDE